MNDAKALGNWGEEQAAAYLRRRGYSIVERNYSCRWGEIDIIAKGRGFIVFVEVKLRKDANFAEAREFVTASKRQRIIRTASLWLQAHGCELQPRFDVLEVYAPQGKSCLLPRINHIEDAFE